MHEQVSRNWWVLAMRGILGIILGLMAFFWPGPTIAGVVMVFGIFALVDGAFIFAAGLRAAHASGRWVEPIIEGILGCIIGVLALAVPVATALAVAMLIGAWAIITGGLEIAAAISLRKAIEGEWLLGAVGVLSILLGVVLLSSPGVGLLAWIWMFGAYALTSGVLLIGLAIRVRGRRTQLGSPAHTT